MRSGWLWGAAYLAAYGEWAWLFRSRVDSWARRTLGRRLGIEVVWRCATTFPLEIWVWGPSARCRGRPDLEPRLALTSTAICLAAAFVPTAALCLLLDWSSSLSDELGPALYLTTPLILLVFVASNLKWRASNSSSASEGGKPLDDPPPSEPPGRFDSSRES